MSESLNCLDCGAKVNVRPDAKSYCSECGIIYTGSRVEPDSVSSHQNGIPGSIRIATTRLHSKPLGLGVVDIPDQPVIDPMTQVIEPHIPDDKRTCSNWIYNASVQRMIECATPLSKDEGFCIACGTRYSFIPVLAVGDIVASQYEVKGLLAWGGVGGIYLGYDIRLRCFVALKGLKDTGDEAGALSLRNELLALARVKHNNIVRVYTTVSHQARGRRHEFIVMEYVPGKTLAQLYDERGPLPAWEVIAYMARIVPALGELHKHNLAFCDMSPKNIMVYSDGDTTDVKLIDLGGVADLKRKGKSATSYTEGFDAPELPTLGASIASDIFSVGRVMAFLSTNFSGYKLPDYRYDLPSPQSEPLYRQFPCYYRLLAKATDRDPSRRFTNAAAMSDQFEGVLHQVLGVLSGMPVMAESKLFVGDNLDSVSTELSERAQSIPQVRADIDDPAAQHLLTSKITLSPEDQIQAFEAATKQFPESREAHLALIRAHVQQADWVGAQQKLFIAETLPSLTNDIRLIWYEGVINFGLMQFSKAQSCFAHIMAELPGEIPPQLALAMCAEAQQKTNEALVLYEYILKVNPSYLTAIFGFSRCLAARGEKLAAVEALKLVPKNSRLQNDLPLLSFQILTEGDATMEELQRAAECMSSVFSMLSADPEYAWRKIELLEKALELLEKRKIKSGGSTILGAALTEDGLRDSLEQRYRQIASVTLDRHEKVGLVRQANRIRRRTLF